MLSQRLGHCEKWRNLGTGHSVAIGSAHRVNLTQSEIQIHQMYCFTVRDTPWLDITFRGQISRFVFRF